jgi:hypothetical protein
MDDLGFDARIWRLEQLLVDSQGKEAPKGDDAQHSVALRSRIAKLQNELDNCLADDKSLRDFVEKCNLFSALNSICEVPCTDMSM